MRARTLADAFRRFGQDAASPVHARVAAALGGSDEALRALEAVPARGRRPAVVLAALHDLALAGRAPALAAAYASPDGDAAARAAVDLLRRVTDEVVAIAARRPPRRLESARLPVLHPAVAEAAHRAGAKAVGLVDVGSPAGFDTQVDRVGVTYDDGRRLGDPTAPVQLSSSIVDGRPVPGRAIPSVVARVAVDRDALDVTDEDDARWLRACLAPDDPARSARLDAAIALVRTAPPLLLRGDPVDVVSDAVARVPTDALPVVTTAWALSRLPVGRRPSFVQRLVDAARDRPVAWVSVEGVGVAPTVPTFGDRPASGHSIIGLALFDGSARPAEALGRCWSRGRLLAWLATSG